MRAAGRELRDAAPGASRLRAQVATAVLGVLAAATAVVSLGVGRYAVPPGHVLGIVASWVLPVEAFWSETDARVVALSRAPRVLSAMLVGGGLALAGATLQGLFRNPLVSAHILGVSSGAAFGGVVAILLSASSLAFVSTATGFGLLAVVVVYLTSRVDGRTPILMLVLSGVITGAFFTALVSVLTYVADPYEKLPAIVFWLMGSLAASDGSKLALLAVPVALGSVPLLLLRWRVNVLSMGDDEAEALGLRVEPVRWLCLVATALIVAGAVAVSGVVGWVGLVVPHLARMLVGPDHRVVLPASFLLGAIYLTAMDNLARTLTPAEVPLGILTALVGAPVFFVLLRRTQARGWSLD